MGNNIFLLKRNWVSYLLLSLSIATFWLLHPSFVIAQGNDIVQENQNIGTSSWQLDNPADDSTLQIKGYASATSVNKGETITFYVMTTPAQLYSIQLYRVGWYDGHGGRLMTQISSLPGMTQAVPSPDPITGLLELAWTPSYTFVVPTTWVSGVYLAKLVNADGYDNYIQFVVRNDAGNSDFLYQQPVTTYQAYNNFPENESTGKSLYEYNSYSSNTVAGSTRAVKVSFDRPYDKDGAADFFKWEHDLIMWMERSGYDVSYSTNIDTHRNAGNLLAHKAFISPGHDEYWTGEMYDAAEIARDQGIHLAFMGANAAYWQIRLEDSSNGVSNRVIVSYQDALIDPEVDPTKETVTFRDVGRSEQSLRGVTYAGFNTEPNADLIIENSSHWLYKNTGFSDGDRVSQIVGYEVDTIDNSLPLPNYVNGDLLASSPFVAKNGASIIATTILFNTSSGAWVFSSGTMSWSNALQDYWNVDSRIQQTTANLFDEMVHVAAPDVVHPGDQDSRTGQNITLTIVASDQNDATLTYRADELPGGLSVNPTTGVISGQIWSGQSETYASSVTVSNESESKTVFFTWIVNKPNAGHCKSGAQEGEDGKIHGNFSIGSDSAASNGEFVQLQSGSGALSFTHSNRVEYCFVVRDAGNYRLKGWVYAPTTDNDSIYMTVDSAPANIYQWTMAHSNGYQPDYLNDVNGIDPGTFYLASGNHMISLHQHEDNIRIDKLALEPVAGASPVVTITAPANGAIYGLSDVVTLSATATDAEDGNLSSSISWFFNIDNPIGSGATVNVNGSLAGTHQISAAVTDNDGLSASDAITLVVTSPSGPPAQANPIAPVGNITTEPPHFEWSKANGAARYRLLAREEGTDNILINTDYQWSQFTCSASTCLLTEPVPVFGVGDYYWQIAPWNSHGYGPWGDYAYFSIEDDGTTPLPLDAPTQLSPLGQINSGRPTFTWNAVGDATEYAFVVYSVSLDSIVHNQTYTSLVAGCTAGGTCTVQLRLPLPADIYTWLLQARNSSDNSPWSVYP